MKKQMKIFYALIIVFGILLNFNFSLANVTDADNGKMKYYVESSQAFDIKGYVNGALQSTTFSDNGYRAWLKVDDNESAQMYVQENSNTEHVINGVAYDITCSFVNEGRYVKILYTLTNNNENTVTISLGVCADVQIASNDRATVERYENSKGLKLYDNESNIQFNFYGKSVAGTTNIDHLWIGTYPYHDDNVFNNNDTTTIEDQDSAFAFSWINRTIEAGDTKTYSVVIGLGEVNNAPNIELDENLGRCFSQDDVVITGTISDQDNGKATLYYTIDNGEEHNLEQQTLTNNKVDFELDLSSQNLSLGIHNIKLWALDDQGNPSEILQKEILITNLKAPTLNMSEDWSNEEVTFTVTDDVNDGANVARYQYKIGDGNWQDVELNTEVVALSTSGTTTVRVKAVGHQTDEESSIVSKVAKLDITEPSLNVTETNGEITITGTDAHSGLRDIKYLISTNAELTAEETLLDYTAAIRYTGEETGNLYLHIVATDNLGNEAKTVKTYEAPVTGTIVTERKFTDENPTYKVTVETAQEGYKYQVKINDGEWVTVTLNTEYTIEEPVIGKNTITTRTVDPLGRVSEEVVVELEYAEDTTKAPSILPDTGMGRMIMIIAIIAIIVIASYIQVKKLKEIR